MHKSCPIINYWKPFRPEPPPFQCNSTIISAYYKIESKHSFEEYLSWMINFLSLKDCMVIFVQPDLAEIISSLRPPSYPALVIPRPWKSFLVNRILTDQQWMKQEARGKNGSIRMHSLHHMYHLHCKSYFRFKLRIKETALMRDLETEN